MRRSANISECGQYRWTLGRSWKRKAHKKRVCTWIGLNPSWADDEDDDQTIKIMIGFCRHWGFNGFTVLNLVPYISTDPDELVDFLYRSSHARNIIRHNMSLIRRHTRVLDNGPVIACWGAHPLIKRYDWDRRAINILSTLPLCLGTTKGGFPRHPLRLSYNTPLVQYSYRS